MLKGESEFLGLRRSLEDKENNRVKDVKNHEGTTVILLLEYRLCKRVYQGIREEDEIGPDSGKT